MKSKFTEISPNYITATLVAPDGEIYEVEYWAPHNGGYVRFGSDSIGKQACGCLQSRGSTLVWDAKRESLVSLMRRTWNKERAAMKRAYDKERFW